MQEDKAFAASCGAWLYDLEARIGMRGILTVAPRIGQNVAIFMSEPLRPMAFDMQQANPSSDPKLLIGLRRAALRRWGFNALHVLQAIQAAHQDRTIGQVYDGNRTLDATLLLAPALRSRAEAVASSRLRTQWRTCQCAA